MKKIFVSFLLAFPILGFAADTNTYSNPTLGITVTKSADWHFMTAAQYIQNINQTKLKDEELQQLIKRNSSAPLLLVVKYDEPFDDVNPSFKIRVLPLGSLPSDDPKAIASKILPTLQKTLKDLKVDIEPEDATVADHKAGYFKLSYNTVLADGRIFPICMQIWVIPIPSGNYFFMVVATTRTDEKTGSRTETQKILNSIKIDE